MVYLLVMLMFVSGVIQQTITALAASGDVTPIIDVERGVIIGEAGMTLITDTITLQGSLGRELASTGFWTGFPEQYASEHVQFDVWKDEKWQILSYEEVLKENFTGYSTRVPEALMPGEDLIKVRASYIGIDWVFQAVPVFGITLPLYPALEYNISSATLHVELPTEAEYASMSPVFNFTRYTEDGVYMLDYERALAIEQPRTVKILKLINKDTVDEVDELDYNDAIAFLEEMREKEKLTDGDKTKIKETEAFLKKLNMSFCKESSIGKD